MERFARTIIGFHGCRPGEPAEFARRLLVGDVVRLHTGPKIQTVRGAFEEGEEAFPGSMLRKETHIQVMIRDKSCILGLFRPNLDPGDPS